VWSGGSSQAYSTYNDTYQGGIPLENSSYFAILDDASAVPEPATWALFGAGLLAAGGLRRRLRN
jgi:hypothetical protein